MLGSHLCRIYAVMLLFGGALAIMAVISDIPAFDPAAREPSVEGGWTVADRTAHYDRGQYLYHLGYAFLNGPEFTFDATSGDLALMDLEDLIARSETAERLLIGSVSLDPANGHIWAALAQAQIGLGKTSETRQSLRRSWELAPHNRQLAAYRLRLLADLVEFAPDLIAPADVESAKRDAAILDLFEPEELKEVIDYAPFIADLLKNASPA